jgi:hypothetical protein
MSGRHVAQFRDARDGRPLWMRALNGAGRWLPGVGRPSAEEWWAAARRGLEDAGEPSPAATEAMDVLVDSLVNESRLNIVGRFAARDDTIRMARNHLRIARQLREQPEILDTEWPPPVFIIGLPRTGTTSLHHLLAQDPRSRTIPYWESFDPIPPRSGPDERAGKVDKMLRQLEGLAPDYHAIHPMSANGAEECVALFMNELRTLQFDFQYRAPGYSKWLLAQDARIAYSAYQRQLRMIQFFRPAGSRFILKDPTHIVHLETVLELFPDARLIFTHRDPASTLSSICSLIAHTRAIFSDDVDPFEIGREVVEGVWPRAVERAVEIRAGLPKDRFIDVRQADLAADPIGTIRDVYAAMGFEFDEEAQASVETYRAQQESRPPSHHEHRAEGFGLHPEALRERLQAYVEDFDL